MDPYAAILGWKYQDSHLVSKRVHISSCFDNDHTRLWVLGFDLPVEHEDGIKGLFIYRLDVTVVITGMDLVVR